MLISDLNYFENDGTETIIIEVHIYICAKDLKCYSMDSFSILEIICVYIVRSATKGLF